MNSAFSLTVLGSGGPFATERRVSSGYLLSFDGRARILVDCGGGTFERIGRMGIDLSALDQILLTHLHIDHTSDLPAVIMHLYMNERRRPITLVGPSGRPGNRDAPENLEPQPGATEFATLLFGTRGAWRYMNTFENFGISSLEMQSDASHVSVREVPVDPALETFGVSIKSAAVPHGMMPSIAFRVEYGSRSIVFSGDISRPTSALIALSKGCSMLVQDFALPERELPHGNLHAKPSMVGELARDAGVRALLLSHFMPPIETELDAAVDLVRKSYDGRIELAGDLQTYQIE
jgi:ribonuclease BN (tRNA processing enzyme)